MESKGRGWFPDPLKHPRKRLSNPYRTHVSALLASAATKRRKRLKIETTRNGFAYVFCRFRHLPGCIGSAKCLLGAISKFGDASSPIWKFHDNSKIAVDAARLCVLASTKAMTAYSTMVSSGCPRLSSRPSPPYVWRSTPLTFAQSNPPASEALGGSGYLGRVRAGSATSSKCPFFSCTVMFSTVTSYFRLRGKSDCSTYLTPSESVKAA